MYEISSENKRTPMRLPSKITRILRLTTFILILTFLQVSAATFGQDITINKKNASFRSLLKEIRSQSGYDFVYDGKLLPENLKIDLKVEHATIEKVLAEIFKGLPLTYTIEGKIVSIKKRTLSTNAPSQVAPIDVRGKVIDQDGKPLPGAVVAVVGGTSAVMTDEKGDFFLRNVDERAVLHISFIGYKAVEVPVSTNLGNIILTVENAELSEVTVKYSTGYQQIDKDRTAGSFAKPDMEVIKNRSSSLNILTRLDGLVPGLTVNNSPSATGNPFLIRGLSTINASRNPLVIVDGIEIQIANISAINPQDVEDITVLKDAASASIWGAKATNGVIVITTKKGKASEKLKIDYDTYYSFQGRPNLDYVARINSRDFINTVEELLPQYAPNNTWTSIKSVAPVPPHIQIEYDRIRKRITADQAKAKLDSLGAISNRDQVRNLFYRNAVVQNHTLSIAGGGKVHTFYGSVSYTGNKSNAPGQSDDRYKINLRQDFNISKRLSTYLVTDISNQTTNASNLPTISPTAVPYQLFKDANGNPINVNYMGNYSDSIRLNFQARSRVNLDYSPLREGELGYNKSTTLLGRIVAGARLNLVKGLRFEGTYGYNTSSVSSRNLLDQNNYAVRNELMRSTQAATAATVPKYYLPTVGGRLTVANSLQKSWTVRNQLLYDLSWKEHQLTAIAGQEATSSTPVNSQAIYRGWDDQLQISRPIDYATLQTGVTGVIPGGTFFLDNNLSGGEGVVTRTTSYYSNLLYTFQRKYSINAAWRIDQSNLFGFDKSAQNRPIWSIGGKWAMGREDFMKNSKWLEQLDIRATYGVTGNAPTPGTAASFDILSAEANVNYVTGAGVIINTPANNKLTWESTNTFNAGLDFGVLKGRLSGSIDLYLKKTHDLIGTLNTAPLTGYAGVTGNFGDMQNTGIELSLNSSNIVTRDFVWSTNFNFSYNKNKITKLAVTTPITTADAMINVRYLPNYPAFMISAYNYAGLNAAGDPQIRRADGSLFSAANGALAQDVQFMGTSQPVWNGGFNNNFRYKDFQLSINIIYNGGNKIFRDANTFWSGVPYTNSMTAEFLNRWKKPGDELITEVPRYAGSNAISNARNTTYYSAANSHVIDAAFAKIRDVSLFYSLPKTLVRRVNVQNVTLRLQVNNIMLWKANKYGIDPEFTTVYGVRTAPVGQGAVTIGAHITL